MGDHAQPEDMCKYSQKGIYKFGNKGNKEDNNTTCEKKNALKNCEVKVIQNFVKISQKREYVDRRRKKNFAYIKRHEKNTIQVFVNDEIKHITALSEEVIYYLH